MGVIVAEGCALEILPKIDFPGEPGGAQPVSRIRKQLIHMLAVARDMEIASGDVTELGWQKENLLEILRRHVLGHHSPPPLKASAIVRCPGT